MSNTPTKLYCALDTTDIDHAAAIAAAMQQAGAGIKLGLEFFNAHGINGVKQIRDNYPDLSLFLDLKFHDIPNTVAGAIKAVSSVEADYVNLHASGGLDMMRAAKDSLNEHAADPSKTKILAVTILTSLSDEALTEIGYAGNAEQSVKRLAALTAQAGLAGVVCSAKEIKMLRAEQGADFVLMVPGIRPAGASHGDQKRVVTPAQAIADGATHLVVGRPITQADNPYDAAREILASIAQASEAA